MQNIAQPQKPLSRKLKWLPITLFVGLITLFGLGLILETDKYPFLRKAQPVPNFNLLNLQGQEAYSGGLFQNKITILHFWATWCGVCLDEHPILFELKAHIDDPMIQLVGINYRDRATRALHWFQRQGDPFDINLQDPAGTFGVDVGIYGTPETFIVDHNGLIQYRFVGALNKSIMENKVLPKIAKLKQAMETDKS